ncbi:hypothetical protein M514_10650 [Trichuris suis]|uniref:DUF7041 domain-containing protein n=1 Tax=Trichuris suis TaxID=68888 RepID=A0A085MXZ0_9BILA|nr:hypothetical protein M513_10650 [Trichuris suis]KFD62086.1 hypothetical protein M514_10650 [Trichuris suis]KHJ42937.1 hypothetical protein D918_07021 [Trichuris suis]
MELPSTDHAHLTAAAAVRLPPFWPHSARLWFAQAEAQFALSKITSSTTKFCYTIAALNDTIAAEVDDLLEPYGDAPYEHIKSKLLERFMSSTEEHFRSLMETTPLGDQRPTCLLREMRIVATGLIDPTGPFFRRLFLLRLPPSVQLVLKAMRTTDI